MDQCHPSNSTIERIEHNNITAMIMQSPIRVKYQFVAFALVALLWPLNSPAQDVNKLGQLPRMVMPGKSFQGPLPDLTDEEAKLAACLRHDVKKLAEEIGVRNLHNYARLNEAAAYIDDALTVAGYRVERQTYRVRGRDCSNLIAECGGSDKANQIIIVGGHYDSVIGSPGANDNATGAAAALALAKLFAHRQPSRTIRFVLFVNEEPPWFQTESMGSLVYARRCKERGEDLLAMYSLETIGYFSDEKESQKYPPPLNLLYPSTGNFIGFVGNTESGPLVSWSIDSFRRHANFPSEGAAVPAQITGAGWSDHWSFWQVGYRALMVTDTAPFRYPHYHKKTDTLDKIDFERMARVVAGFAKVIEELAAPVRNEPEAGTE
jgi:peptidase M28-like protein